MKKYTLLQITNKLLLTNSLVAEVTFKFNIARNTSFEAK